MVIATFKPLAVLLCGRSLSDGWCSPQLDRARAAALAALSRHSTPGHPQPLLLVNPHLPRPATVRRVAISTLSQMVLNTPWCGCGRAVGAPSCPWWSYHPFDKGLARPHVGRCGGQQAGDSGEPTPAKPNGKQPAVNLSPEREQRKRAAPQPPVPHSGMARSGARRDKAPKSDEQRAREGIADIQRARGQR